MRRFSVSNSVLLIICLMYLILYVDRVNISTAAPLIKADLDLTNTQFGLAFSAFAYAYALFQLIGGYIGDRFGPRLTLCLSSLIVCVATAAAGVVEGSPVYSPPGLRPHVPDCHLRHGGVDAGAQLGLRAGHH